MTTMKSLIQQLAQQARHTFQPLTRFAEPQQMDQLIRLTNYITAKDVNFDPQWVSSTEKYSPTHRTAPVTYVHIYEDEVFSLGIFILKNGYALPLHDHPGMYGICKVIHGKISVTAYSPTDPRPIPESLAVHGRFLRPTVSEKTNELTTDSCCCLSPIDGNFHEIKAVDGPAAFLDVLAPPYGNTRDCRYYKDVLKENGISWLLMVPQPRDFWCEQARYSGPSIEL